LILVFHDFIMVFSRSYQMIIKHIFVTLPRWMCTKLSSIYISNLLFSTVVTIQTTLNSAFSAQATYTLLIVQISNK